MSQESVQSLSAQGQKAYQMGSFGEAAKLFEQAARLCLESGDALTAAEMSNNQSVALLQHGDAQGALEAAQNTDVVFAQADDKRRQAMAIGNQAAALEALDRPEEALTRYWQCADLLKQDGDKEYRAMVLKSISALQIRTGKQFQAIASMQAALENQKKLTIKERFLKRLLDVPMQMLRREK